jgi:citrate synthase
MDAYGDPMVQGLDGVVAAATRLSHVDGERGELVIAGFPVGELAAHATFEETTWLLWHGDLPSMAQLDSFRAALAAARDLAPATLSLLRDCARANLDAMDALRAAAGTISLGGDDPRTIVAVMPTMVAAYWRLQRGEEPIARGRNWAMRRICSTCSAARCRIPEIVRGLETYLNTVVDHGLNASTFTARVITSTGSDLVSAVVGALGALKGPLHGGAPWTGARHGVRDRRCRTRRAILRRKIEGRREAHGIRSPRVQSARPSRGCARRRGRAHVHARG